MAPYPAPLGPRYQSSTSSSDTKAGGFRCLDFVAEGP